jgi:hypothetical protein
MYSSADVHDCIKRIVRSICIKKHTPSVLNYSSFQLSSMSNFSNFDQVYRKIHQHPK